MIFRLSLDGDSTETRKQLMTVETALSKHEASGYGFTKIGTAMWEGTVPTLTIARDVITILLNPVIQGEPSVRLDHFFVHIDGSDPGSTG